MYDDLNDSEKQAIDAYLINNGIELTIENKNLYAQSYVSVQTAILIDGVVEDIKKITPIIEETRELVVNRILEDTLALMEEYEQTLIYVNHNSICSPLCQKAQGNVYSTENNDPNFPFLDDYTFRANGWKKYKALFHRNCRHWVSAYIDGEELPQKEDLTKKEYDELYKQNQGLAYLTRNKELWKNKFNNASRLNNQNKKYYQKKFDEWKIREKTFIKSMKSFKI